jgi:hypothetical protein
MIDDLKHNQIQYAIIIIIIPKIINNSSEDPN